MIFQDVRDYQILFLSVFLFLGIYTRDWTLRLDFMLVVILSCLITQFCLSYLVDFVKGKIKKNKLSEHSQGKLDQVFQSISMSSWRSALITGLGLCLLLRANNPYTMAIAGGLAIASKFLFCYQDKHFFNPANFGIIGVLVMTNDAWVSPGQWGNDWWYLLLFIGAGGIILQKVGRWDTSAIFLLAYASLEAVRNLWLGWSWDVLQHQLMSGSLLLFALFMLTDPRSIPNATISRLIWAVLIAIISFILQHQFYFNTAIFWALFIVSPLTIYFDSIWLAQRFKWTKSEIIAAGFF